MTTPILKIDELSSGMVEPYVKVNEAIRALEAAANGILSIDLSSGDYSVTNTSPDYEMLRYFMFSCSGNTVSRTLTFSDNERHFAVSNLGSFDLLVSIGATSVTVPTGASYQLYADGTTDGLIRLN